MGARIVFLAESTLQAEVWIMKHPGIPGRTSHHNEVRDEISEPGLSANLRGLAF